MEAEFPIEEIEDRDLYLKYIKSQDKLIPLEAMVDRFDSHRKAHVGAIFSIQEQFKKCLITQDEYSMLYDWHAELARRADQRMRKYMELEAKEEYDKNQRSRADGAYRSAPDS